MIGSRNATQVASQSRMRPAAGFHLLGQFEVQILLFAYWLHGTAAILIPGFSGSSSSFSGLSLLAPFSLLLICGGLIDHRASVGRPSAGATLMLVLPLLIPSSLMASLAMTGYALLLAAGSRSIARALAICAAGLAVAEVWTGIGRRLLGPVLLEFDAIGAALILSLFKADVTRIGTIVAPADGHTIILFADCASASILPGLMSVAAVMALRRVERIEVGFLVSMSALFCGLIVLNFARLALLASSDAAYEVGHGPIGQNLFDALAILLATAAAMAVPGTRARTSTAAIIRPHEQATQPRALIWVLIIAAICILGLGGKLLRYGVDRPPPDQIASENVISFIEAAGWVLSEEAVLIPQSGYHLLRFRREGCAATITISVLSTNGESLEAVAFALGANAAYIYSGLIQETPSRGLALRSWLHSAIAGLGFAPPATLPPLAITPPPPETADQCLPPPVAVWRSAGNLL